jgi:Gpi18-like mannosyltransferase
LATLLTQSPKKDHLPLLFAAGLFITETLLSLWTGMAYDMNIWFHTGQWMNQGINIYLPNNHIGYPPLWAFWCLAVNRVYTFLGNNTEIWRLTIKLPLILAQFALAFVLEKFAERRFDKKTARKIFWVALTWSFFIYIGALWGQLNTISALLTFSAFWAIISKRTILGGFFLGLAVTLKIYPLIVLPAFLGYLWKNRGKEESGKFLLLTCGLPVAFTLLVFTVYHWDTLYFLKTIFYWTPAFDANPVLIQGGCMNIWSFLSLLNVDISQISFLRFIWIPAVAAGAFYWFRKRQIDEASLNLSLISFYLLFMLTYSWVSEQTFLDPLPFIFLQIFGYNAKKSHFYLLVIAQVLVFAFSAFNWGPFVFEPLFARFSPDLLGVIQHMDPSKSSIIWTVRGLFGLFVSVALAFFLAAIAKPRFFKQTTTKPTENTNKN